MKLLIHSPNFNGCTVEVWEWISNFIPHFWGHVITYACYFQINVTVYKWISHSIDEQFNMVFTNGKGAQAGTIINVEKITATNQWKTRKWLHRLFFHTKKDKKKERYILPNQHDQTLFLTFAHCQVHSVTLAVNFLENGHRMIQRTHLFARVNSSRRLDGNLKQIWLYQIGPK